MMRVKGINKADLFSTGDLNILTNGTPGILGAHVIYDKTFNNSCHRCR